MAYDLTDLVFEIHTFSMGEGENELTLTCADKAVLNVLATRADKNTFQCWPGYGEIADRALLSRQGAIDSVAKLKKMRFFTSVLIGGEDSPYGSNLYTLDVERLKALAVASSTKKAIKKTSKAKNGRTSEACGRPMATAKTKQNPFDAEPAPPLKPKSKPLYVPWQEQDENDPIWADD
jgi:hypothetical protein